MTRLLAAFCLIAVAGCASSERVSRPADMPPPAFATDGQRSVVTSIEGSLSGETVTLHLTARGGVSAFGEPEVSAQRIRMPLYHMTASSSVRLEQSVGVVSGVRLVPAGEHTWLEIDLSEQAAAEVGFGQRDEDLFVYVRPGESGAFVSGQMTRRLSDAVPTRDRSGDAAANPNISGARWRLDTIVIDAGHGGKDPGTSGHGIREKDVVLSVSRKVGAYLERELGVRVVYTRTDDTFVPLAERGRIANRSGGKLFVSIHANAAGNPAAYGTETFFMGLAKNSAAQRVMERENAVVRFEDDQSVYDDLDEEALILRKMANAAYLSKSESLAALIEGEFRTRVGRKSRGVKQGPFQVLWGASMPSILVELGFLTNREEAQFLSSEQGQDYMASAIFRAVRDFKAIYDREIQDAGD